MFILFTIVAMTGSALPDNGDSGQINSDSIAIYMLDAGHYHLGDGVKHELMPADAKETVYTITFVLNRIDGDTAGLTLTTKSVVPTDTAGIGLFYDQVYHRQNHLECKSFISALVVSGLLLLVYGVWQKRKKGKGF